MFASAAMVCYSGFGLGIGGFVVCGVACYFLCVDYCIGWVV